MKKPLALLLSFLLLCGCAVTYDGPTRTEWVIGKFTKEWYTPWSDDVDVEQVVYSYDIHGNLAQTLTYKNGAETAKTVFTYDDRGNLLSETSYSLHGWFPRRSSGVKYTYDEQNRITSATYDDSKLEYIFDDEARTWTQITDGEITQVVTYDENHQKISEYSAWQGYWSQTEYIRDEQGRTLSQSSIDSDGVEQSMRFEYDAHGSTIFQEIITGGERTVSRSEYEYDEQGRVLRHFRLTDSSRTLVSRTEYLDENGSRTLYDPDGTPNQTVIYDGMGHLVSNIHYMEGTDQVGLRETTTYIEIQVPAEGDESP